MTQFMKRKWQTVAVFMLAMAALAFLFSVVQPQKYSAQQRFLVVQKYAEDVDPYAASRATEYLTNLLSQVMYSQSFMNQVLTSGYGIDKSAFPSEPKKLKKAWQKTLRTRVVGDTGMLEVSVYFADHYQSEQLALAIGQVLRAKHGQYHGRGSAVTIQTIDQPITSLRPVQPNIALNTAVGAVLGLVASLAFVYLFPQREIHLRPRGLRLMERRPDWSKPMAKPSQPLMRDNVVGMYEASEMKPPRGASHTPEPPANLPIA